MEGKIQERGGGWYKDRGKCIKDSRIKFPDPMLMTLDNRHSTWTFHKVFEKMPEKCGKKEGGNNFFPTLVFDSKTRSQFRPACKKSERNLQ